MVVLSSIYYVHGSNIYPGATMETDGPKYSANIDLGPDDSTAIEPAPDTKSTGPRTEVGKSIASRNALKHGIFSANMLVAPGESLREYDALLSGLCEHFQPVGTLEDILVEKLAVSIWRYRRLIYTEAVEMRAGAIPWKFDLNSVPNVLDRLPRYEASIERSFERILSQLERIQRMRLGQPVAPPIKVEISPS
jgi:hypothetical protein